VGVSEVVEVQCTSIRKAPGGKTVKVDLTVVNDLIINVVISGDFFLYPEEAIHDIEASIRNRTLNDAIKELNRFKGSVEFLGTSMDDIINLVIEAYNSCTKG